MLNFAHRSFKLVNWTYTHGFNARAAQLFVLKNQTQHFWHQQQTDYLQQKPSSPNHKYPIEPSTTFSEFPFGSNLCFEILQWSACINEFPLSAGTCCIFPSCWTEWNGSEPKRNRVASAEKWALGDMRERKYGNRFSCSKSVLCPDLCQCRFYIRRAQCVWVRECVSVDFVRAAYVSERQKVSKLAVLTCRLEGGALEKPWTSAAPDEELESAWKGVWFPMWSPCSPAQSCRDWDSEALRWAFQRQTVQLHHIDGRLQELWRRWNAYNNKTLSLRISLGIVILRNFWLGEVRLQLYQNYKERGAFKEVQNGRVTEWATHYLVAVS